MLGDMLIQEMRNVILITIISAVGLVGCTNTHLSRRDLKSPGLTDKRVATIYYNKTSNGNYLQIHKVVNKSCYCSDAIAERFVNHRLVYRFYYGCSIYKTRKLLYSYCSQGAVFGPRLFDEVKEDGTAVLDSLDKFVIHKIDSFVQVDSKKPSRSNLCKKDIKEFEEVWADSTVAQQSAP